MDDLEHRFLDLQIGILISGALLGFVKPPRTYT